MSDAAISLRIELIKAAINKGFTAKEIEGIMAEYEEIREAHDFAIALEQVLKRIL